MKITRKPAAIEGPDAGDRRRERQMAVMRALFITREADGYVFAGFHYDHLAQAVAHATRYLRKDAIGATIMLRPADSEA